MGLLSDYTDIQLIDLLSKDDRFAFTELYNRYWSKLFNVAVNKLDKDLATAEELVQDIFMDLWLRRKDLRIKGNLASYLAVALKYKVIDTRIKKKRLVVYKAWSVGKFSIRDTTTEQQLQFRELKRKLELVVQDLPERSRLIYTLSRESGCSNKEIACKLSISPKTVEAHLTRITSLIRKKIRSMLIRIIF